MKRQNRKMLSGSAIAAGVCTCVVFSASAFGQTPPIRYQPDPDSPIGMRNENAPARSAQFDFVIGDWDVDIILRAPGREPQNYQAKWHNHWIVDGFAVMQEWRGPYATGAEFRYFDASKDMWTGYNLYPGAGWSPTTARFEEWRMIIFVEGGSDSRGAFLARETYYDIEGDSFKMKSSRSYDDGETWESGEAGYAMTARRSHE